MKKKGFTLVELLAVIVILAIIALITIPLVIKTINNSEIEGEKKSIDGYVRAEESYIQNDMMQHPGRNYSFYKDKMPFADLEYKGNTVICEYETLDDDHKIKLTNCYVTKKTREEIDDIEKEGKGKNRYNYEKGKVIPIESGNQSVTKTAVQELLTKTNPESVTTYEQGSEASHQMYTFSHPATEQTGALTDYRYIGSNPYNYVEFNDEVWRIIGVFTVKNGIKEEQIIKLIRDEKLPTDMNWNSSGVNEWSNATLNTYLNGEYYQNMSNLTQSMIEPVETYLGVRIWDSITNYGGSADMYAWERGTTRYNSNRSVKDIQKITLLYPSDYYYTYSNGVDTVCYNDGTNCYGSTYGGTAIPENGWLYKSSYTWWLVSPYDGDFEFAFRVDPSGRISTNLVASTHGIRPVVYLKSAVQIASGTGTSSNPYKLKI